MRCFGRRSIGKDYSLSILVIRGETVIKYLFTTFEGGGHVPPAMLMAGLLVRRGHSVLFVSDEANRAAAHEADLDFRSWETAPNRQAGGRPDDPLTDWQKLWPPAVVKAVCDAVITGPSHRYATDVFSIIGEFQPDLVVTNELLFGVLAACEALNQAVVPLTANLWCFPNRADLPPFGPGWGPALTRFAQRREVSGRQMLTRWYDTGLPALNSTRQALGLGPVVHVLDQLGSFHTAIVGTSTAFDFPHIATDAYVYSGPLFELKGAVSPSPLIDPVRRNILVSFSTTYQNQARLFAKCLQALAGLDANIIVTTGPAVDPAVLPRSRNARIVQFAPHAGIVPWCDIVICHGGHGTLLRPIVQGVPVMCLPMGRDHPDNAQRIKAHGAGIIRSRYAPGRSIRRDVSRLLTEPSFRRAATTLGQAIARSAPLERERALQALEKAARLSAE